MIQHCPPLPAAGFASRTPHPQLEPDLSLLTLTHANVLLFYTTFFIVCIQTEYQIHLLQFDVDVAFSIASLLNLQCLSLVL